MTQCFTTDYAYKSSFYLNKSGELQFDFTGAAAHGSHDDFHVVTKLGHQLQQLGFADTAKLSSGDARYL